LAKSAGKEDPVELDSSLTLWKDLRGAVYRCKWNTTTFNVILLTLWVRGGHCPSF